jgi:hypothetical protein
MLIEPYDNNDNANTSDNESIKICKIIFRIMSAYNESIEIHLFLG